MEAKTFVIASLGATLLLSGCAMHRNDGEMAGGMCGQHGGMKRMCEMHKQMTAGKTPAEQQAAMEAHIKSMHGSVTPEMVSHHAKMMEMHCGERATGGVKN